MVALLIYFLVETKRMIAFDITICFNLLKKLQLSIEAKPAVLTNLCSGLLKRQERQNLQPNFIFTSSEILSHHRNMAKKPVKYHVVLLSSLYLCNMYVCLIYLWIGFWVCSGTWQVDAFTDSPFKGNPAAVCLLEEERDEQWLQAVAAEFNISMTCYLTRLTDTGSDSLESPNTRFHIRWFTPVAEVSLLNYTSTLKKKSICFKVLPFEF